MIYGISGDSLIRINPENYEIELLGTYPGMDWGLGIARDRIYLYSGTDLLRFAMPPVVPEAQRD